jgi:hypothetical protein
MIGKEGNRTYRRDGEVDSRIPSPREGNKTRCRDCKYPNDSTEENALAAGARNTKHTHISYLLISNWIISV